MKKVSFLLLFSFVLIISCDYKNEQNYGYKGNIDRKEEFIQIALNGNYKISKDVIIEDISKFIL